MQEQVTIQIDGLRVQAKRGRTILDVARTYGIYIPTLCYYPELTMFGACRVCLVEVEGFRRPMAACTTQVTPDMVIRTDTPEIKNLRKTIVELMLLHHPLDCLTCDRGGNCELQKLAFNLGVTENRFGHQTEESIPADNTNLLIQRDFAKCMMCGRCVRVCDEVRNVGALGFFHRGLDLEIGYPHHNLANCEFCGQCLSVCPTGALISKLSAFEARPWQLEEEKTICPYCGCGCTFRLAYKGDKVVKVTTQDDEGTNRGLLCVKGRFGYDFINSPERLTSPLIKENGSFREVSWDTAVEHIAQKLKDIKKNKGAQAIGGIASGHCTNEENYLFEKLFRAVLGTNNIDTYARMEHAPSLSALTRSLGIPAATNSLEEIREADTLLVIGSNPTTSHILAGLYIKQAVRNLGSKLILIDPCSTKLASFANCWLRPQPGTDLALLCGLAHIILAEGWEDRNFISDYTEGLEKLRSSLEEYTPQRVAQITGVSPELLRQAAESFASAPTGCIIFGAGVTRGLSGTDNVQALLNLLLLTGKLGRKNCGIIPLCTSCNLQGACDMGALPDFLPGYQPTTDEAARAKFNRRWGVTLPDAPGLSVPQMVEAAAQGKLAALYIMGENLVLSYPDYSQVKEALQKLDFLVVQDLFLTETAKLADVVLPAASFAEKDGTFTNLERRVQRLRQVIEPQGGAMADWRILCDLATALGYEMDYSHPEEVMEEIRSLAPIYRGISYYRLAEEDLCWPCLDEAHMGKKFFTDGGFADRQRPVVSGKISTTGR